MKEHLKEIAGSYFISVTLINIAICVTGLIFRPEQTFGYDAFLSPLIFGFLTVIPTLIMYSSKELTVRQLILRKAIQLLLDIVIVTAVIFAGSEMNRETVTAAIGVSVSIVVVFTAVHLIEWLLERRTAKLLTEELTEFQRRIR
ncbi:MAG: hypothetical protein IJ149_09960 [Oscillospiraceae bacterium]|nr:hypothetical protein [Oscillospiraceae bacterium]